MCKYLSWSSASDCQESVQIGSLKTLWHDDIAYIDDTACPGRKTAFWYSNRASVIRMIKQNCLKGQVHGSAHANLQSISENY